VTAPWFVQPEVQKIDLEWEAPDGSKHTFWIECKRMLSIGEERAMMKSIAKVSQKVKSKAERRAARSSEEVEANADFDWTEYSFARMLTYITDWSLTDEKGNKIPRTREKLNGFHQSLFQLIDEAVDEHTDTQDQEKKVSDSESGPKPT
jgi:hypothetical protein